MAIWRIRRLPVVEDDGRLVGMLAQADLVHELKDKKAGQLVEEISQPGDPVYGGQESRDRLIQPESREASRLPRRQARARAGGPL